MDARDYLFDPTPNARAGTLCGLSAGAALRSRVERGAQDPALVDGPVRLSWAALAAQVDALANALALDGVSPGDVVGLYLPNGRAFVVAHLALASLGAVTLPLHVAYRERELAYLLDVTGASSAFAADAACADRIVSCGVHNVTVATAAAAAGFECLDDALSRGAGAAPARPDRSPDEPLALIATSATESSRPKLCIHTHDGLLSNAVEVARLAGATPSDRLLSASAYTHLFGLLAVHVALVGGCTLVAGPRFDARTYLAFLREARPTMFWAAPPVLRDLVALDPAAAGVARMREVRTGGSAIGADSVAAVRAALGDEVVVHWGMSEVGAGIMTRHGERADDLPGTIGTPIAGADIVVAGADGRPCPPGESGELWYRRADMLRGYYRDSAATEAALAHDGWLRTGDLARLDAAGRVFFVGRAKDIVNRGGLKISAFELESLLSEHPAVRQVAVVAVPDERLGERAAAVVALHDGHTFTIEDARAFLEARGIAKFKWPERWHVVAALPTTATNKVAKAAVRALVAELTSTERAVRA